MPVERAEPDHPPPIPIEPETLHHDVGAVHDGVAEVVLGDGVADPFRLTHMVLDELVGAETAEHLGSGGEVIRIVHCKESIEEKAGESSPTVNFF